MMSKARPSPTLGSSAATREIAELLPVQVLAHALIDARVGALQVEQRAHDVHVEALAGEFGRRDDRIGDVEHQLGERGVAELGVAQLVERGRLHHRGVADEMPGEPGKRALAAAVGVVGLLQRGDQPAQEVVGVVGYVRRHLRVAEVGLAAAMGAGAQGADQVRLAGAGLAMKQEDARLHGRALRGRHGIEQVCELAPRCGMHQLDIDRVGAPDVILPGDGVLESRGQAIGKRRNMSLVAHETSIRMLRWRLHHQASTRMK
jgi:hypothetical protein